MRVSRARLVTVSSPSRLLSSDYLVLTEMFGHARVLMDVAVPTAMRLLAIKYSGADVALDDPEQGETHSRRNDAEPLFLRCAGCCCCAIEASATTLASVDCAHRLSLRESRTRDTLQNLWEDASTRLDALTPTCEDEAPGCRH